MGSLAGKSPKDTYKSLLKVADETNGVSTSTSVIEDGEGTATCMSISDDQVAIVPQNPHHLLYKNLHFDPVGIFPLFQLRPNVPPQQ